MYQLTPLEPDHTTPTLSISNMQIFIRQRILAFVTVYFVSFVFCAPIVDAEVEVLQTRQVVGNHLVSWWEQENFVPKNPAWQADEPYGRIGQGDCVNMGNGGDKARSAKTAPGWKCTFYQSKGCHGARTREFDSDGIESMRGKMLAGASAFRCCEIGYTNSWGICRGELNPGS